MCCYVHIFFQGPLYFEAIHKEVPLNIIYYILKSGADFTLKDEVRIRGVGFGAADFLISHWFDPLLLRPTQGFWGTREQRNSFQGIRGAGSP